MLALSIPLKHKADSDIDHKVKCIESDKVENEIDIIPRGTLIVNERDNHSLLNPRTRAWRMSRTMLKTNIFEKVAMKGMM